jgi:cyclopropane fatty-acyl-phospholipid synthase-like methyltransferase
MFRILDHLSLNDTDVFGDLGCGKGRAICCAARYQIAQVIGVECLDNLCELARRNVQRLRGRRSPTSVVNVPAEDFDYSCGTAFYLFNPFGPATMREVLGKLRSGLDARPRVVRIAYVNPMHEEVLAATPWLKRYAMLPDAQLRDFNPTSFWTT